MSRLQFTTGAGHRRGRARQTRPMRSRHPPCRRQQRSRRVSPPRIAARAACRILATPRKVVVSKGCKPNWHRPRFKVNFSHCARFVFLPRAID